MPYVVTACRMLLLTVFAVSAWSKLRDRSALHELADSLAAMRLARSGSGRAIAITLVAAEATTALMLALPWPTRTAAFGLAAVLLTALSGGVAIALHHDANVRCRCFGPSDARLGRWHLIRNLALLAVAAAGLAGSELAGGGLVEGGNPAGLLLAGGVGVLLAVLVVSAEDIANLFGPAYTTQKGS